jgi:hypothetical protein
MWTHPVDREDASPEIQMLGRAWQAIMSAQGGYGEEAAQAPEWAEQVFAAFAASNPGFDRAECMTPEWLAEKRAAYAAGYNQQAEMKNAREKAVVNAAIAGDAAKLVELSVTQMELMVAPIGARLAVTRRIIWGRGDIAVAVK